MAEQIPAQKRGRAQRHVVAWPALTDKELDTVASKAFVELKGYTIDFHVNHRSESTSLQLRKTNNKLLSQVELLHYGSRIAEVLGRRQMRIGAGHDIYFYLGFSPQFDPRSSAREYLFSEIGAMTTNRFGRLNETGTDTFSVLQADYGYEPSVKKLMFARSILTRIAPNLAPIVLPVVISDVDPTNPSLFGQPLSL